MINPHDPHLVVGVIGAGTMGRGIAQVAATAGLQVRLFDADQHVALDAHSFIGKMLDRAVEKQRMGASDARTAKDLIRPESTLEQLAVCDVVIEAIVENIEAKSSLFARLDRILHPDAVLASNTSSLSVTRIAAATTRAAQVAGFHFFNPPPLMKLIEVVRGLATSDQTLNALVALAQRFGKQPVVCTDTPGFLVNHAGRAYMPEAMRIVSEGICEPADVDRVMRDVAGFRLGPFQLVDLVGLDIAHGVMQSMHAQYYGEPTYRPFPLSDARVAAGLLGRKTQRGFYDYADGKEMQQEVTPPPAAQDAAVWIWSPETDGRERLTNLLKAAGASVEIGERPSADAFAVVAPLGDDVSSCVAAEGLPPERTVGVDLLCSLEKRRTLMCSPATSADARQVVHGLLAADGAKVTVISDSPGFIVQRILAMVINIACNIAQQRVAAPKEIDMAVKLGLNYPSGPLEWGDQLGAGRILSILCRIHTLYGDDRYRPSPWLRRRAELGLSLLTSE